MADYVTLLGAEQVQTAARNIQAAAEQMTDAVRGMYAALDRLEQILREDREARTANAVECCPYCGGTKGHWEGCRSPVDTAPPPNVSEE